MGDLVVDGVKWIQMSPDCSVAWTWEHGDVPSSSYLTNWAKSFSRKSHSWNYLINVLRFNRRLDQIDQAWYETSIFIYINYNEYHQSRPEFFVNATLVIRAFVIRLSNVLFRYHEKHQYSIRGSKSCSRGPMSFARGFIDPHNHFDIGDKWMSITQKIQWHVIRFPFNFIHTKRISCVRKLDKQLT